MKCKNLYYLHTGSKLKIKHKNAICCFDKQKNAQLLWFNFFFNLAGPFARDQFKYSLLTQVKHVIFYGALFDLKNFSLYAFKSS